jgi:hypothetical protein
MKTRSDVEIELAKGDLINILDTMRSGKVDDARIALEQFLLINYKFNYTEFLEWRKKIKA